MTAPDPLAFYVGFDTVVSRTAVWRIDRVRVTMARRGIAIWPLCLALGAACGLAVAVCGPLRAEPMDACGLATTGAGLAPPASQTITVTRVTGPNSFAAADGREIRLASVSTPHRFVLGPSAAAEVQALENGSLGEEDDSPSKTDADQVAAIVSDPIASARSTLGAWLIGQTVTLYPVTPKLDRYGRIRARVVRVSDGLWIEAELVMAGLARVEPQSDDFGCARHLETIEARARASKRGIWGLPEFAVVEADDVTRDRWIGHYMLIEGKVVSIGTSGTRRYLNFGRNFSRDFAVLLVDKGSTVAHATAKRTPGRFQQEGFDAPAVVGRRIRVRGCPDIGRWRAFGAVRPRGDRMGGRPTIGKKGILDLPMCVVGSRPAAGDGNWLRWRPLSISLQAGRLLARITVLSGAIVPRELRLDGHGRYLDRDRRADQFAGYHCRAG